MELSRVTAGDPVWTDRLAAMIRTACVWEATARKPGNVHPQAAFEDASYEDFVRSADAIAPVLARTQQSGVGRAIREAVAATRLHVGNNTNLGIILLLAPLAAVPERCSLSGAIKSVLAGLTVEDAIDCYAAIREATPGGLGQAETQDVEQQPTITLREAMRLAAQRDRIAAQYDNGFHDVLARSADLLNVPADSEAATWERAIIALHLRLMAELPDTLIARKCGWPMAEESARRAQRVLEAGWPFTPSGDREIRGLDEWLRADGNRRNPGTTADLIAAILFAAQRDLGIKLPQELPVCST